VNLVKIDSANSFEKNERDLRERSRGFPRSHEGVRALRIIRARRGDRDGRRLGAGLGEVTADDPQVLPIWREFATTGRRRE